jgi:hypothetical protein
MIWLLNFLPDFVFHLIVLISILGLVAATFFGFIPFVGKYALPVKIVSIVMLVIGIWFEGGISNNDAWLAKVKEMELKVAKAEAQSAETNTKLAYEINVKNKIIKENSNANSKAITRYVTDECKLSNAAVSLHNSSSRNEVPSSTIGTITGTSNFKTVDLLTTVNENYDTYYELVNIVKGWQKWYIEQKQIFESVK